MTGDNETTTEIEIEPSAPLQELIEAREELDQCWALLREQHPAMLKRMDELKAEIPGLQEKAKAALREHGAGLYRVAGHSVGVARSPMKRIVDSAGLIERARERGELEVLLREEVLVLSVQDHMILRLDGVLKAIYCGFVEQVPGTARVSLPDSLK